MPSGYHFLKVKVEKLEKELKETQDERWELQNKVRDLKQKLEDMGLEKSKDIFYRMVHSVEEFTGWAPDPAPVPDPPKNKKKVK